MFSLKIRILLIALFLVTCLNTIYVLYSRTNSLIFSVASSFILAAVCFLISKPVYASFDGYSKARLERERLGVELAIAARIQAGMIPYVFPAFPGRTEFDIYASMLPAKEIGGDFYDFFLIDEDNLAIVIADISGKGIPSALFMSITKTLIKNNACLGKSPAEVFKTVNNALCENNNSAMFVTAFMAYYNTSSGNLIYANAGHNPPYIKKSGKDYEIMKIEPCLVLGCIEDIEYKEGTITLESGDNIFLYTDGITEAMNPKRELFSETRLHDTLQKYREKQPKELINAIKHEIDVFVEGEEQADDITMLALKIDHLTMPKKHP